MSSHVLTKKKLYGNLTAHSNTHAHTHFFINLRHKILIITYSLQQTHNLMSNQFPFKLMKYSQNFKNPSHQDFLTQPVRCIYA